MERMYCHRVIAIPHMVRFHVATEVRTNYILIATLSAYVRSFRFVVRDDPRGCRKEFQLMLKVGLRRRVALSWGRIVSSSLTSGRVFNFPCIHSSTRLAHFLGVEYLHRVVALTLS